MSIARRIDVLNRASHHPGDDLGFKLRAWSSRGFSGVLSITKDDHTVGKSEDLVHAMRDVDDSAAFCLQSLQNGIQLHHFRLGQCRGGLVEHQDACIPIQGTCDFDELTIANRQVPHARIRAQPKLDSIEELLHPSIDRVPANPAWKSIQFEMLSNGELGEDRQLLVDHGNAGRVGVVGILEGKLLAVHEDAARVGPSPPHARENLHECRLARAILPTERNDLSGTHLKRHVTQGTGARELLGHGLQAKHDNDLALSRLAVHRFARVEPGLDDARLDRILIDREHGRIHRLHLSCTVVHQ